MNMFEERSYGGRLFRPTPEVHIDENGAFGVVATPWGNRGSAKKAIEVVTDFVHSARQDMEATSPFQKLTCLSPLANSLRVAMMLANDTIYREENKAEYVAGVELLMFARHNRELAFAQAGCPLLFLARERLPWIPLGVPIDLSLEHGHPPALLPPLPHNLIGLHNTTNMNVSSFTVRPGDRLVFLSHSVGSSPLFSLPFERTGLDHVSTALSSDFPDLPFWLGVLSLPRFD